MSHGGFLIGNHHIYKHIIPLRRHITFTKPCKLQRMSSLHCKEHCRERRDNHCCARPSSFHHGRQVETLLSRRFLYQGDSPKFQMLAGPYAATNQALQLQAIMPRRLIYRPKDFSFKLHEVHSQYMKLCRHCWGFYRRSILKPPDLGLRALEELLLPLKLCVPPSTLQLAGI